jgi:hypothetical protein
MIPKVNITLLSGTLGAIGGNNDGVAGMVIGCDPTGTSIVAGDKFTLRSIDDAKVAGLNDIAYAYQQIKEFYNEAGIGAKLYVIIAPNTETLENMADPASGNAYGKKLLDYAAGEIAMLGICRKPAAGYTPTVTKGMDNDAITAMNKLQAMAATYLSAYKPFVGLVEGRSYQGNPTTLDNLTAGSNNHVGVLLAASKELHTIDAGAASIGLLLGRAAAVPVQRKVARVKDGALSITGAYYGAATAEATDITSIDAKGYITIGTFANKAGYFFMDDLLATATTDDYKTISARRTMNKLVRIAYVTYINEVNDDIELTDEGKLTPATAKFYEGLITNAINLAMTANGELSSFSAYVDPNQNVLSTSKVTIRCAAVPKGYSQQIDVVLGFSNPALA